MDQRKMKSTSGILSLLKMGCIISTGDHPSATRLRRSRKQIVVERRYDGKRFPFSAAGLADAIAYIIERNYS